MEMARRSMIVVVFVCGLVLVPTLCDQALADQGAVGGIVAGGSLYVSIGGGLDLIVSSDQKSVSPSHGAGLPWTVTDARGTGESWSIVLTATDFVSAPGDEESTPRTIDSSNLSVGSGPIISGPGSDRAPSPASVILSSTPQTFIQSNGEGKGNFTFTPVLNFTMPAGIQPPNHVSGLSGTVNPYVSRVIVTIG